MPTTATTSTIKVWDELLKDLHKEEETQTSTLLVLGRGCTGKLSLIRAFQKIALRNVSRNESELYCGLNRCKALDYAYIETEAHEDINTPAPKCNVWILEEPHYKFLLEPFFGETDLLHCIVLICIDLSQPWSTVSQLSEWLSFLVDLITPLMNKLPFDTQQELREKLAGYLKKYTTQDNQAEKQNDADYPIRINLGIPIVVCVTNSSHYKALNTEKYPSRHDVVLAHIRKCCLPYGAAICYVSDDERVSLKHVDVLYSYLKHRTVGSEFTGTVTLTPPDGVFIPSGWDTEEKLATFVENTVAKSFDVPLESLLPPRSISKDKGESQKGVSRSLDAFLGDLLKKQPELSELISTSQNVTERVKEKKEEKTKEYFTVAATETTGADYNFATTTSLHSHRKGTGSITPRIHGTHPKPTKSHTARGDTESLRNFFQMLLTKHPTGSSTARYTNSSMSPTPQ